MSTQQLEGGGTARHAARLARLPVTLRYRSEPSQLHELLVRAAELAMEHAPERLRVVLPLSLANVRGDLAIIQRIIMHTIGRAAATGGNVEVSAWQLQAEAEQAGSTGAVVVVRMESVLHDGRRVDPSRAVVEELRVPMGPEAADAEHATLIRHTSAGIGHRFELHLAGAETGGVSTDSEPSGKQVLVVERDSSLARRLWEILGYMGAQVDIASGGMEALGFYERARLAGRPYELVFLDPGSCDDRSEFAGFAQILRHDHEVRVVVCVNDDDGAAISGCSCRFDARLPRNFRFDQVRRLLA